MKNWVELDDDTSVPSFLQRIYDMDRMEVSAQRPAEAWLAGTANMFASAVHRLFNNTMRACGCDCHDGVSENTYTHCEKLADVLEKMIRSEWSDQDLSKNVDRKEKTARLAELRKEVEALEKQLQSE